ncbi:hypothetical protein PUN28_009663 [Cardiocondyla obscurior]|uniref:Uncharacterized protein n=1 Tax=Cardiocondyla obscurior TaxID=286306 RepID=A0AAW2FVK0_9HYME
MPLPSTIVISPGSKVSTDKPGRTKNVVRFRDRSFRLAGEGGSILIVDRRKFASRSCNIFNTLFIDAPRTSTPLFAVTVNATKSRDAFFAAISAGRKLQPLSGEKNRKLFNVHGVDPRLKRMINRREREVSSVRRDCPLHHRALRMPWHLQIAVVTCQRYDSRHRISRPRIETCLNTEDFFTKGPGKIRRDDITPLARWWVTFLSAS